MPMCAASSAARQRGFSLVEVLCAVAIAASAIVVLSRGATSSLEAARSLEMHQGAGIILQSILSDELAAETTAAATRQGESGPYRWRLEIAPDAPAFAENLPSPYRIYRLTASVSWDHGGMTSTSVIKISR
jgi:prepilin-type N-terminal cleavage/methylation domain-containing protein